MIEQEDLEVGAFALRAALLLQRSLVHEIAVLVAEVKVDCLSRSEYKLCCELSEIEAGFSSTRFVIDLR